MFLSTIRSYVSHSNVAPLLEAFVINPIFSGWVPILFGVPSSRELRYFKSIYSSVRLRLSYDVDSAMLRSDVIFRELWDNED